MKKIFGQIKDLTVKHRKKLIYGILAFFVGQIFFFGLGGIGIQNEVLAEEGNSPTNNQEFQTKATSWIKEISFLQNVIYMLTYPILVVAAKLVDNSLVYGEVFNFDVILWKLWNMVRNLANFALGFIFVYKIFESLLKKKDSLDGMKKLIISTLIAGIGIQASWFIMAALIDVSTLITYSVGGLPITILGNNGDEKEEYNPYVYQTLVYLDADKSDEINLYLSNTDLDPKNRVYISECEIFTYTVPGSVDGAKETLILSPKNIYYKTSKGEYAATQQNICHYDNKVYIFSSQYVAFPELPKNSKGTGWVEAQLTYDGNIRKEINKINENVDLKSLISQGKILQIGDAHAPGGIQGQIFNVEYGQDQQIGADIDNKRKGESLHLKRLNDTINVDGSYLSVFSALYSSLINAGFNLRVSNSVSDATYVRLLNILLSFGHALAISIPLIVMAIVFMLRIGVLWMAIALSPMIVLLKAFDLDKWLDKNLSKGNVLEYLKVENLIPIIFSPAIICFAVSLSTVLVRLITTLNWQNVQTLDQSILGGIITIDIASLGVDIGKMLCSVIGIAITWFLVRAAVQSSKLGESGIVTGIKNLAQTSLGSIPIVPVIGPDGNATYVGANAAFGLNGQQGIISSMTSKVKDQYSTKDNQAVQDLIDFNRVQSRRKSGYIAGLSQLTGGDWTTQDITIRTENGTVKTSFSDFNYEDKKSIIAEFNKLQNRAQLSKDVSEIDMGKETYYRQADGSYSSNKPKASAS